MAAIAVEPVIAATTVAITEVVEKSTEAAVVAAISAAVAEVVEAAVATAISAAIDALIVSAVSADITAKTTVEVEIALQQHLNEAVKDVIGSRGLGDLSKAMATVPSDVAVNKLAKEAIDKISPHLWVFKDPAFLRLTRLIRALRVIQKGKKPGYHHDDDSDDDDCDEEKCRFFKGPEVAGDSEDFIFFTAFGSSECKEGDEVYSMSAQWKKLKSLVDDPIGGHYVSQLFEELFESCEGDVQEDEVDSSILAAAKPPVQKVIKTPPKTKVVKVSYGKMVYFGGRKIYNICGSSNDKRLRNWKKAYFVSGFIKCCKCYIAKEHPECKDNCHKGKPGDNIVGGHVWSPQLKKADKSLYYYILPICKCHNKQITYDEPRSKGTGWMLTTPDAWAMKITSTDKVVGWKGKYSHLIRSKTGLMLMTAMKVGKAEECHEIIEPKQLTNWVLDEVHQIALEFAKGPIKTVFKEVSSIVLGKLQEIIKSAGSNAESWARSEGFNIMLQSLIPLYGIYQAIKRLSSLYSDAMDRFHSGAQSALLSYKNECLSDEEQKRREQRLVEETDKVIASKEWKDRMIAFEKTIASKVPEFIEP